MIVREQSRSVEETRDRIFTAARQIFALKGPHGTTTREIADRAGVNEATLFRHFGNKNALLDAMKEHFCRGKEERLRSLFESLGGDLEEDLLTIARAMIEGIDASKDLIRVGLLEEATVPDAAHAPWRAPHIARAYLKRFLSNAVERGELHGDPDTLARFFMGMFFSYIMARNLWKESALNDAGAATAFVGIFLRGTRGR